MNNLKNYSKPVMKMEQFVPQQYVADCWKVTLGCDGGTQTSNSYHFIFSPSGQYIGDLCEDSNTHDPHQITVPIKTEAGATPSNTDIDNAINGQFADGLLVHVSATTGSGANMHIKDNDYLVGYYWNAPDESGISRYHFAQAPTTYLQNGNHS